MELTEREYMLLVDSLQNELADCERNGRFVLAVELATVADKLERLVPWLITE